MLGDAVKAMNQSQYMPEYLREKKTEDQWETPPQVEGSK